MKDEVRTGITARVYPVEGRGKTVAMASIELNEEFVISGVRVVSGCNGLFVSFPQKKNKNGDYDDIAFPVTSPAYKKAREVILRKYEEVTNGGGDKGGFVKDCQEGQEQIPFN